ncbi:transcription initiation factor TFIID subunit 11-like [Wolffia australiana]
MLRDPFEAAIAAELEASSSEALPEEENGGQGEGEGEIQGRHEWPSQHLDTSSSGKIRENFEQGGEGGGRDDDDEDEEEDNVEVDVGRLGSSDLHKVEKIKMILSQFTKEQMDRYESFRRSNFQRSNMKKLLTCATGNQKVSMPMTIVMCGIAKMFVGDLIELGKIIMTERRESGPLRPCHIREAYRRLKLEGKVPRNFISRLF